MTFPPRILSLRGLALIAGAATISVPALADRQDPSGADRFPIPVESIEARRASVFAEVDANGDGLVSQSEFMDHEPDRDPQHGPGMFRMKDFHGRPPPPADGRREADPDRMAAMDDAVFATLDTDGNGSLSRSEFSAEALADARRTEFRTLAFTHLDADGDGYLTPAEFPPAHLAALDTDGDGEISRAELRARHRPGAG